MSSVPGRSGPATDVRGRTLTPALKQRCLHASKAGDGNQACDVDKKDTCWREKAHFTPIPGLHPIWCNCKMALRLIWLDACVEGADHAPIRAQAPKIIMTAAAIPNRILPLRLP